MAFLAHDLNVFGFSSSSSWLLSERLGSGETRLVCLFTRRECKGGGGGGGRR